MKFVPVKVTGTLLPTTPLDGLTEVSVGPAALTVKVAAPLVPPLVVTVTLAAPSVAFPAMAKVAVICVALTTVTPLTVTPGLLTATVAPAMKFVPVKVTGTLLPTTPLDGLTEVNVGPAH